MASKGQTRKKVGPNYNFALLCPEEAKEWHPQNKLKPNLVAPFSHRIVKWICHACQHEWETRVGTRARGKGCPSCAGKRPLSSEYNLAVIYPQIAKEWNFRKNQVLKPEDVTPKSNQKVWWECNKKHEWQAIIANRTNLGRGCPYCSGREATPTNNLKIKYPEIAKQWHSEQNGDLKPEEVGPKSGKRFWWICEYGHEWQTRVYTRTGGAGCPRCHPKISRRELRVYCELQTVFNVAQSNCNVNGRRCDIYLPKYNMVIEYDGVRWHKGLAQEQSDKKKNALLSESGIIVLRVREHGLKKLSLNDIVLSPRDTKRIRLSAVQRLLRKVAKTIAIKPPELRRLNAYLLRTTWANGRAFKEMAASGPRPLPGKALADTHQQLAEEWHYRRNNPWTPDLFTSGSDREVWWLCEKGHEWKTTIGNRARRGSGCPACSGRNATEEENLAARYPVIASQWHPTKNGDSLPQDLRPSSNIEVWWLCGDCEYEWKASPGSRTRRQSGCPSCSGVVPTPTNNLKAKYPEIARQWHNEKNGELKPDGVLPKSNRKVWWKCAESHEWEAFINNRTGQQQGCPYCSGKRPTPTNNLKAKYPEIAKRWHNEKNGDLKPEDVPPKSNKKVWWQCEKGHEWEAVISKRTDRGQGCPYCSGRRPSPTNNLKVKYPEIATQWNSERNGYLKPEDVTPMSHKKVWWKCSENHDWQAIIAKRTGRGAGCPECRKLQRKRQKKV